MRREHLILESANRLLEGFAFTLKASVTVNFRTEGTITNLPDSFVHAIVPHVVAVKESEYVSGDKGGRCVDVDHGCCVDLAVISRPVERQPPFGVSLPCSFLIRNGMKAGPRLCSKPAGTGEAILLGARGPCVCCG
jgi:hypothetical protein